MMTENVSAHSPRASAHHAPTNSANKRDSGID
jgi:hypothetical protein